MLQKYPGTVARLTREELLYRAAEAAQAAFKPAKPMDNTDYAFHWRKEMVKHYVKGTLEELRG